MLNPTVLLNICKILLKSIFSYSSHVFRKIKNPHIQIVKNVLPNIQAKFCFNLSSSSRGDFQSWKCKIQEKKNKKSILGPRTHSFIKYLSKNFGIGPSDHADQFYSCKILAYPNWWSAIVISSTVTQLVAYAKHLIIYPISH